MMAAIGIPNTPPTAAKVSLQHHDMMPAGRDHAGSRYGPWKPQPVRSEVQGGDNPAKEVQGRPAAAERMRTARRPSTGYPAAGLIVRAMQPNPDRPNASQEVTAHAGRPHGRAGF